LTTRWLVSLFALIALCVPTALADANPGADSAKPAKSTKSVTPAPVSESVVNAKPEKALIVETLIKAHNQAIGKDLFGLCGKTFQGLCPAPQLDQVLKHWRAKYGRFIDDPVPVKVEKSSLAYRIRCEKQSVHLKIGLDKEGRIAGLTMSPAFLDNLPATLTKEEVQRRLTEAVEQSLYSYRIPSISLALVKGDEIVWEHAFGHMNRAKSVPADPETVYVTGSIFKVVIATALMQLVDEGKLDLDAPVSRYLKNVQIANPFEKEAPLTVRQLLCHRGGIPNGAQIASLWARHTPMPLEETVKKRVRVVTKPGSKFEYSNYGFTLNGYLLGAITDTSVDWVLRERLLRPLGMTRTAFEPTPAMLEDLAVPYQNVAEGGVAPVSRVRLDVYPAGDVYSTAPDMARFLILHLNEGKYHGKQIVSAKSIAEMAKLQFAKKDEKSGQGLGWMIDQSPRRRLLWHNGAVPGFFSYMAIDPGRKVGVALFMNLYNPLEVVLGVHADPLLDLRELSIELLARLNAPQVVAKP
jgi:CubicO group peptidase (beta-lactamase class C family)